LLDGFKRYFASEALQWEGLEGTIVEADDITAKVMMLTYNQKTSPLVDYEEAQIVYSLRKDHLMGQQEIAGLLSRSISWVSRRLGLMEKLDQQVKMHLQLGKITPTHARELIKLPRGKQGDFLKVIIGHCITSRQTALLVAKYLQSKTTRQQQYVLDQPLEVIERATVEDELYDPRLSVHGNRLLKTSRLLARQQHIFIGQMTNPPLNQLSPREREILLPGFRQVLSKTKTIESILIKCSNNER
jgi:ParB-like chromosome segregation protein Spo0J